MTNFLVTVRFFLIHIIIVFFTTSKYVRYGITVEYYVSIESAMYCDGEKKEDTDRWEGSVSCVLVVTYIIDVLKGIEHVVRKAWQKVDDKPALEIIHADYLRVWNDLPAGSNKGSVEVEHDVHKEDNIYHTVNHKQRQLIHGFDFEGCVVGHHHSRIEGQGQDDPVPYSLEEAIM